MPNGVGMVLGSRESPNPNSGTCGGKVPAVRLALSVAAALRRRGVPLLSLTHNPALIPEGFEEAQVFSKPGDLGLLLVVTKEIASPLKRVH